jgi:hypothetical protein
MIWARSSSNPKGMTIWGKPKVLQPRKQDNFDLLNHPRLSRKLNKQYYMAFRLSNQPQKETNPFLVTSEVAEQLEV